MLKINPISAVEAFYLRAKVEGLSKGRVDNYNYTFKAFSRWAGERELAEIDQFLLRGYFAHLQEKNLARRTIATQHDVLRTFFNFCHREGFLVKNPMDLVKPPKLPRQFPFILNDQQTQALVKTAHSRKTFEGIRNYAMILTFLDSGIRRSEMAGLNLRDLNLEVRSLRIIGKGGKERIVFLGRVAARALRDWLNKRGFREYDEGLFITRYGEKLKLRYLDKMLERLGKKAGVTGVRCSPHTLRHTFATNYIRNGGDPFSLQQLLGHSDIKTVMIYVHMGGTALREAHAKFSPVDRMASD